MLRNTALLALLATVTASNLRERSFYEEKFVNWMSEHKVFARDGDHFVHMLKNFIENDQLIEETNAKNLPYKLGHNQFSHMNRSEWSQRLAPGLLARANYVSEADSVHDHDGQKVLASEIDWEAKGAVTPVKDQGSCGSCWAFSTTGALEGAYKNKYGSLVSFSEQELVDCDNRKHKAHTGSDMGCNGGLMDSAFKWIKAEGKMATEDSYPYVSGTTKEKGDCKMDNTKPPATVSTPLTGYVDVKKNSDSALESALNIGPVSVAIQADQASFQLYKSGVFTGTCGTSLDHGVLAVGYGVDAASGLPFYKVKNSWGTSWGDKGYIYLVKGDTINKTQKQGQCGILSGPPSYPTF